MTEIWKTIPNCNSLYEVSNCGRVRSYKNNRFGLRKTPVEILGQKGIYKTVAINGKSKYIHRLVAEAFIPNPNNLSIVNHIDGNKYNNNADNLEWTTYSGNVQHALNHGLVSKCKKVICLETKEIFMSITELGKKLGISQPYASTVVSKGKYKNKHYEILGE